MAGLVPAIHVFDVAGQLGEESMFLQALLRSEAISDSPLKRRGVDGRDKLGHDKEAPKEDVQRARARSNQW